MPWQFKLFPWSSQNHDQVAMINQALWSYKILLALLRISFVFSVIYILIFFILILFGLFLFRRRTRYIIEIVLALLLLHRLSIVLVVKVRIPFIAILKYVGISESIIILFIVLVLCSITTVLHI